MAKQSKKAKGEVVALANQSRAVAARARAAHARLSMKHHALQVEELQDELQKLLAPLSSRELPAAVRSIGREFGIDPNPIIAALGKKEPTLVFQQRAPGFTLDGLDQCYQDACSAAGGDWVDTAAIRGCKAKPGLTEAQKAATFLAYHINSLECLARAGGGILGKIWGAIAG